MKNMAAASVEIKGIFLYILLCLKSCLNKFLLIVINPGQILIFFFSILDLMNIFEIVNARKMQNVNENLA